MEITDDSAWMIGRLMGRIQATDADAVVVGLTLETEENAQEFFAWCRSLTEDPTPQACVEKAIEIWEANGPWPKETDEEITDDSARLIGRLTGSIKGTKEDAAAIVLTLGTEENAQEFFAWCKSLTEDPTPQTCFEKAVEIREANGPWPEETDEEA